MAWHGIERLLSACREAAAESPEAVKLALMDAVRDPAPVLADLPDFEGDDLTLLASENVSVHVVRQFPHVYGPPHDHGMWAIITMLEGLEVHRLYAEDGVTRIGEKEIGPGTPLVLNPTEIHAIGNPLDQETMGIHVYLGDLGQAERRLWDPATGEAVPFSAEAYARLETRAEAGR